MANILRVENLSVALPAGSLVVRQTDVSLAEGSIVTLLGPSGAGKTTLLRAIFSPQELKADGYQVQWSSREIRDESAFVPRRGALLDHLDVLDNVALAQAGGKVQRQPERWLEAVDLDAGVLHAGRPVSALSGGQAQRVAVARVLAAGRRLIVRRRP